jgi:hypothetical protein
MDRGPQDDWVQRVLGISVGRSLAATGAGVAQSAGGTVTSATVAENSPELPHGEPKAGSTGQAAEWDAKWKKLNEARGSLHEAILDAIRADVDETTAEAEWDKISLGMDKALDLQTHDKRIAVIDRLLPAAIAAEKKLRTQIAANAQALQKRLTALSALTTSLPDDDKTYWESRIKEVRNGDARTWEVESIEEGVELNASLAQDAKANQEAGTVVSFGYLQVVWRDAQKHSHRSLDQFVKDLLDDPEIETDPRFEEAKQAAGGIARRMPAGDKIEAALRTLNKAADDTARAKALTAARVQLQAHLKALDGSDILQGLQKLSNDDYGGLPFLDELRSTLEWMDEQLAGAEEFAEA